MPEDPENKDKAYKYPFVASNVLNQSSDICKYLLEGGMPQEEAEPEEDETTATETPRTEDSSHTAEEVTITGGDSAEPKEDETKEEDSEQFKQQASEMNDMVASSLAKDKES
jgi:hypothetical protein